MKFTSQTAGEHAKMSGGGGGGNCRRSCLQPAPQSIDGQRCSTYTQGTLISLSVFFFSNCLFVYLSDWLPLLPFPPKAIQIQPWRDH